MTPKISMIAAIQKKDRGIGNDNKLLFAIKEDLQRFKALTTGHPIVMGRKTFESIGRPLPNRTNIVITRNTDFVAEGCVVVSSLDEAIGKAKEVEQIEIFIIGGGEIYKQALPFTDRLYITEVEGEEEATVFFPEYTEFSKIISEEKHPESNPPYTYFILEK